MRKGLWGVVIAVIVLALAWARVAIDGHLARVEGDRLLAAGQDDEAVGFFDRALHMYWPGSPDVARAVRALTDLAESREASADTDGALHAWRILRSGLYATRGSYQPYPEVVAASEERIAAILATQLNDPAQRAEQLALMRTSHDPSRGWSAVALAGFALWVAAAFAFIWRGISPEGAIKARAALQWAAVFVAGYVIWLAGLYLA